MRPLFRLSVLLVTSSVLLMCAPSGMVIYPAEQQEGEVERFTRQGYDFLRSEGNSSTVTLSLRSATRSYVQAHVAIENDGSQPVSVVPQDIVVRAQNGRELTFEAYNPVEAPTVVQQSAQGSAATVYALESLSVSGQTVVGEQKRGGGRGGYGSESSSQDSYLELMLQEETLSPNNAMGGLVYTPFEEGVKEMSIEVPVGQETHVFNYNVQIEDI